MAFPTARFSVTRAQPGKVKMKQPRVVKQARNKMAKPSQGLRNMEVRAARGRGLRNGGM